MKLHSIVVVCAVLPVSAVAGAQGHPELECKKTETQAECFARLKCQPNEELEACQKRLRQAADSNAGGQDDNRRGDDTGSRRRDDSADDRDGRDRASDRGNRDSSGGRDRYDNDGGRSRRRHGGGGGGHSFVANKTFGLGLELGEPTGLNGKYFLSDTGALDFGVGEIYDHYYYGDGFHLYADYLWHFGLTSTPSFELPFYIGAGLRFWDFHYCVAGVCDYDGSAVGIRVPLGISFDFNNVPLDIFVQLVPTLDFLGGNYYTRYRDREHFGIDGSVGIRLWFK